ncbi:MAG TPA: glycosyltransferase family A protein [Pseudolysinimonas sp.]|nr:glycosyltransferase family A protein [Pseudolysinimonas sp.]
MSTGPTATIRPTSDLTVILTCYNHQAYVEQCLESVFNQTRPARQVIVIDDQSRDDSANVIEHWLAENQPNWTYIRHTTNVGVCASLNEALALAEGQYFCQVSADDWIELDRFEHQTAALDASEAHVAVVVGDIREVEAGGGTLVDHDFGRRMASLLGPDAQAHVVSHLLAENTIPAPGAMMRTEMIRTIGGYDESLAFEDYDMWLRLADHHAFTYEAGIVANYRVVASGMTRNVSRRATVLHSEARVLAKHIGKSKDDDLIIAKRLLAIAANVLELGSTRVARDILRLAARVDNAPWIRRAIWTSRLPGGRHRIRTRHAEELGIAALPNEQVA